MNTETAIQIQNLSKVYHIGKHHAESLRDRLHSLFSGAGQAEEEFRALDNINLEIKKGEAIGVIGRNGAGKSTLLKLLSRITHPSTGRIEIEGRVASLLEVGTGFHPELTGRENIFLNGTILGMTRREVKARLDEIIAFSGVEKFIDTPVKHYSSGMYVRLAFAVAAHLEPEILIIDEVLAVGDAGFQKKCLGKMDDVTHSGKTVIFVSHNMAAVKSLCQTGLFLEKGKTIFHGPVQEAIQQYEHLNVSNDMEFDLTVGERSRGAQIIGLAKAKLNANKYFPDSAFTIDIGLRHRQASIPVKNIQMAIFIADTMQNIIYHCSTEFFGKDDILFDTDKLYRFQLQKLNLSAGTYSVWIWLQGNGFEQDYCDTGISFEVLEGNIYGASSPRIVSMVQKEFEFDLTDAW